MLKVSFINHENIPLEPASLLVSQHRGGCHSKSTKGFFVSIFPKEGVW